MASTGLDSSSPRFLYLGLLAIRVCFAFLGTGYIHPDEYFQNGEVVAGNVLGIHSMLTWEWDPVFPCRSIVPVCLTTGFPLSLLSSLLRASAPQFIFVAERLPFLLSSLILDYSIYHLVHESARLQALLLISSSYVMHTYQVRPFSNSLEAVFVALSLVLLKRLFLSEAGQGKSQRVSIYLASLAFTAVCGVFTRITFAAFFLPIALEVLKWGLRTSRFSLAVFARLVSLPVLVAVAASLGFVYADTVYFQNTTRPAHLELTPLNFLRYNMLPSNLAEHGLHPRWLHLVVNLPMIATPGLLYYVLWSEFDIFTSRSGEEQKKPGVVQLMQRSKFLHLRWSATSLLSIQPHQEPRFLTPLLVPMIAMAVNNGRILRAGRSFMIFWVVANSVLAVLFGVLHQGGVVPSLFRIHDMIYRTPDGTDPRDFRIVYWKTYMPPRHLLAVPQSDIDSHNVSISDLAGASANSAIDALLIPPASSDPRPLSTLLVAPFHSVNDLIERSPGCLSERARVFPHLDLDHIAEAVRIGWKDGLSLGIFDVDPVCMEKAVWEERAASTQSI
ncbi:glycosyltransferase family 22 protein [Trametes coccinea BRFM310]|uniref:Mannosyltransferase n=1 Tax=Trametes coccinea (strain BRFM310) TaxID=1353009 RepID=A0A1Y2III3_TRAC3|nr:glycosyltransferase family 22 protein [Trametes coccinea BRFM310]